MGFPPTAWNDYKEARFRLAGFGGAAVFLRTCLVPAVHTGGSKPSLAMDVGFVSPKDRRHFLARAVANDFPARLSEFLLAAAADTHPEQSVAAFQDETAGLVVAVETSTESRVCLDWRIVEDFDADVRDFEGLNFETSRAALVSASHDAALLCDVDTPIPPGVDY